MAKVLARFFVQQRAGWQRRLLTDDLEADGYLAIVKAARTYDPKRLPYPKAYFARAVLNAMCRSIKKLTRQPGFWKISLAEADQVVCMAEDPDFLRLAIEDLGDDAPIAASRFIEGMTLRQIAAEHEVSLRVASVRARALARTLSERLGIQLRLPGPASADRPGRSSPGSP
jgi:DNA-directed RNA polymerase specialized sigma subunit